MGLGYIQRWSRDGINAVKTLVSNWVILGDAQCSLVHCNSEILLGRAYEVPYPGERVSYMIKLYFCTQGIISSLTFSF